MKQNAYLAKVEAKYKAAYDARVTILLQMCQDAACIAAHEVLQMGPGRAEAFGAAYRDAINEIAALTVQAAKDDPEIWEVKARVDRKLCSIVGAERFTPWEERYG